MGRSNKAARRRNSSNVTRRREKGEPRFTPRTDSSIPRVPAEDLIIPDGYCHKNPKRPLVKFNTRAKAQAALDQARIMRARMRSGRVEKRFFECEVAYGGCGGYHLTSRDDFNDERTA